jgi:hypothetical protein
MSPHDELLELLHEAAAYCLTCPRVTIGAGVYP